MRTSRLMILLLPLALVALALAMGATASLQRNATEHAADRTDAAAQIQIGTLDQETGLRGYLLNGRSSFLEPFRQGRVDANAAAARLSELSAGDEEISRLLADRDRLSGQWTARANRQVNRKHADSGYYGNLTEALERKELMDRLRVNSTLVQDRLVEMRDADLRRAGTIATATIIALSLLIGLIAVLMRRDDMRRRAAVAAADAAYHDTQRQFTEVIQVVDSEAAVHDVLKRHLELRIADSHITILDHNVTDDCLEATTPVPDDSVLHDRIVGAKPSACLAVRLARPYRDDGSQDGLIQCELCGHDGAAACQPLLVGGKVIGSVLSELGAPVAEQEERRIEESVAQAAPVLANLRTLSQAEMRASTDALTGLPNRRSFEDTLQRMCMQALRSGQAMAAISFDLDRFKDINDRFGHEMGDTVLTTAARIVSSSIRASDFCARVGGEEFAVLAPDTDLDGAKRLAETLRTAFEAENVNGLDRRVTASFGIAMLPIHARDPAVLMRLSDRALYAAKSNGRNRIEVSDEIADTPAGASSL